MIVIKEIKGNLKDKKDLEFRGLDADYISVSSFDAVKCKYFTKTHKKKELLIDVSKGNYLSHQAILFLDKENLIYVSRKSEHSVIIDCNANQCKQRCNDFAIITHALGNLHIPVELDFPTIKAPITTSADIIHRTIDKLNLYNIDIKEEFTQLALSKPLFGLKA